MELAGRTGWSVWLAGLAGGTKSLAWVDKKKVFFYPPMRVLQPSTRKCVEFWLVGLAGMGYLGW